MHAADKQGQQVKIRLGSKSSKPTDHIPSMHHTLKSLSISCRSCSQVQTVLVVEGWQSGSEEAVA